MIIAAVDIYEALLGMVAFATIVLAVLSVRDRSRRNVKEERDELLAENQKARTEIAELKQIRDKLEARTDLTTFGELIQRNAQLIEKHEERAAQRGARAAERDERFLRVLDRIAQKLEIPNGTNGKEHS